MHGRSCQLWTKSVVSENEDPNFFTEKSTQTYCRFFGWSNIIPYGKEEEGGGGGGGGGGCVT
jgi:hypothetical protein